MTRRIHHLAGVLAAAGLSGCIVLPPPMLPMPPRPPPMFRGGPPPFPMSFEHRGPPMAPWDLCEGQPEGARPALPGPRADALSGSCERGTSGALEYRAPGPR
ncbi:hypothetical protein NU688_16465 [Variovorax sp. ZS18.2.2]|uniref:hypothetical protein n=1 Tax=Variovorax sp. ZS18.2.2 TaxID=2971255 RepID=UPI002150ABD8|nr:hypothetical protein [Variovorax sp. ZS18.2.2]MCR6477757.1 hypothetical protein [Variovorax sp. ZS18.2.2]